MSSQGLLFACSKCFSRHPFEELSANQQLCKECRGAYPIVKCTYCRSEFQQTSKGNTSTICKKCEQNVKQYGKPSACELCNIIAAFIGSKCQRCTNSELKYGPAVTCEQCKQRCAFNRQDHKVDGKLLCWLCTLSYKRALAKARQVETDRRRAKKRPVDQANMVSNNGNGMNTMKTMALNMNSSTKKMQPPLPEIPDKIARNVNSGFDPNSSDHVVAMTQLKETIASLQKKISQKDNALLQKDKEITELKGKHFTLENEMRTKMKDTEKTYEFKIEILNKKLSQQLKEIAVLSRNQKRGGNKILNANNGNGNGNINNDIRTESSKDSGGSGTDSPITN